MRGFNSMARVLSAIAPSKSPRAKRRLPRLLYAEACRNRRSGEQNPRRNEAQPGDLQPPVIAEHGSPPSSARGDFRGSPPTFCAKFQMIYAESSERGLSARPIALHSLRRNGEQNAQMKIHRGAAFRSGESSSSSCRRLRNSTLLARCRSSAPPTACREKGLFNRDRNQRQGSNS